MGICRPPKLATSITFISFYISLIQIVKGGKNIVFTIHLISLTSLLMFPLNIFYNQIRYKLFESVNEIYPQNKSIQSYLALENYLVTKCGWLWLCTTFAIVMTLPKHLETIYYGVNR